MFERFKGVCGVSGGKAPFIDPLTRQGGSEGVPIDRTHGYLWYATEFYYGWYACKGLAFSLDRSSARCSRDAHMSRFYSYRKRQRNLISPANHICEGLESDFGLFLVKILYARTVEMVRRFPGGQAWK